MSSYAVIYLQNSGEIDSVPLALDPKQESEYGQGFHQTWAVLDHIAEINEWEPLSHFYVEEDSSQNEWYDPKIGLETVSGLLNKYVQLIGLGAIGFTTNASQESQGVDETNCSKDEVLLIKALREDPQLSYALWDLRAYELILHQALEDGEQFRISVG